MRENEFSWPDAHGEDQMGRLSDIHSQPVDGNDDRDEGELHQIALVLIRRVPAAERRWTSACRSRTSIKIASEVAELPFREL